jgi:phage I-like protein
MNSLILNRDFQLPADGFYHIAPLGEFPVVVGDATSAPMIQVLDQEAVGAMVNRFSQDAQGTNFPGVLVDFDHFSSDTDKPSEAAGWIAALENRADGLWAQIRWTDIGEAAVRGGRYRLASPVFSRNRAQELGGNRIRPLALISLALTNDPNIRGMVPLSNRNEFGIGHDGQASVKDKTMNELKNMLGLAADATDESVLEAVKALVAKVGTMTDETAKAKAEQAAAAQAAAALKNRVVEVEAQNATLAEAQAEGDLEKHKSRFAPEKRGQWKAALLANRATALALLESITVPASTAPAAALMNRATAGTPAGGSKEVDQAVAAYRKEHNSDFDTAWKAVRQARPELF